ncbi:MAG: ArsR/SmtB family transcription factor [Phycisphaerae bacterium]
MEMDQLSTTFGALADPTRRAILSRLASGESSVTELAKPFNMTLPAISKHLKVLENARLITRGREAQWRPCRLNPAPLKDASGWIEEYRKFWEESLDRLEVYLEQLQPKENKHCRKYPTKRGQARTGTRHNTLTAQLVKI